jgi:hypothetical protein
LPQAKVMLTSEVNTPLDKQLFHVFNEVRIRDLKNFLTHLNEIRGFTRSKGKISIISSLGRISADAKLG